MIILQVVMVILGLVLLWLGSDFVIESAKKISQRFHLSQAFIGLTIISIGTSLPEIFTTIYAALDTKAGVPASGIGVGINIGSSINLMTIVIGVVAYAGIMRTSKKTLSRDGVAILLSILALYLMGLDGVISRSEGALLVLAYIVYLIVLSKDEHDARDRNPLLCEPVDAIELKSRSWRHHPLFVGLILLFGFALLAAGSKIVVENAIKLTDFLGVTQTFIGVVILSIGGCLPELVTSIRGIKKKTCELSLGTIIGSSITDPLFSLGTGAVISGMSFSKSLLVLELPFWALCVLTVMLLLRKNMRIERHEKKQGVVLISLYFFFILLKIVFFRGY
jgi:cation:H+ antiporter